MPDYQHHSVSLRQLTGKGRSFLWLQEHQVEFDKLKSILSSSLVIWHFDHTKPVYLLTDASRLFGLGYALGHMEKDNDNVSPGALTKLIKSAAEEVMANAEEAAA